MPFLRRLAFALLMALAACREPPRETVAPALWEVSGPQGQKGWLFGTIHALPQPVAWRSAKLDAAIAGSDVLVLEIGNTDDPGALAETFTRLSRTPGQPPVEERVPTAVRPRLRQMMREVGLQSADFADVETWAVALTLSQKAQGEAGNKHGLESELLRAIGGKPVGELEGGPAQLGIFDSLPEADQRDLLAAVVVEATDPAGADRLCLAWKRGDVAALERETRTGLLADPELRQALLIDRNRAWTQKVAAMLAAGKHPLVAVGAAHMAGPDGLPALLAARGYKVTRIQ